LRYYKISISDPSNPNAGEQVYTSLVNGQTDPGALQVELDCMITQSHTPSGSTLVKIWGVGLPAISQAKNLNPVVDGQSLKPKFCKVFGGFAKGLPLANPKQSGLLFQGNIQQAFGNWQGLEMSLELIIYPGQGEATIPKNIVLDWKANQKLSDAISNTLKTAFPDYKLDIAISDKLTLAYDQAGAYQTLVQFATAINVISRNIVQGNYPGVSMLIQEQTIRVYDGTSQKDPLELDFTDMIGQPTWIDVNVIMVKLAMRADLLPGAFIKLPKSAVNVVTTAQSFSQYRQGSVFQGSFQVQEVRHVGSFRVPDANAWCTIIKATPTTSQTTQEQSASTTVRTENQIT